MKCSPRKAPGLPGASRIEDARAGYARLSMTIRADMLNGRPIVHGGMVFALADTAFAYVCNGRNEKTVAAQASIVFLGSAHGGRDADRRRRGSRRPPGAAELPASRCERATAAPSPSSPATRGRSAARWSNRSPWRARSDRAARHRLAVEDHDSLDHRAVKIDGAIDDASSDISALGVGGRPRALPHVAVAIGRASSSMAARPGARARRCSRRTAHCRLSAEVDDRAPSAWVNRLAGSATAPDRR